MALLSQERNEGTVPSFPNFLGWLQIDNHKRCGSGTTPALRAPSFFLHGCALPGLHSQPLVTEKGNFHGLVMHWVHFHEFFRIFHGTYNDYSNGRA